VAVTVPVSAVGDRDATVVVQGYVTPLAPSAVRPPKELKVWSKQVVAAGTTVLVTLHFDADAFHRWDPATHSWIVEPGEYDLVIAASVTDERSRVRITIT
jgi:beta-glucosidase